MHTVWKSRGRVHEVFAKFWEGGYIGVVKIWGGGYTLLYPLSPLTPPGASLVPKLMKVWAKLLLTWCPCFLRSRWERIPDRPSLRWAPSRAGCIWCGKLWDKFRNKSPRPLCDKSSSSCHFERPEKLKFKQLLV